MDESISLSDITPLKVERWRQAWSDAEKTVRLLDKRPQFEDYLQASVSKYPTWVTNGMLSALALIAVGALIVSAGKQLAAADIVLEDVIAVTKRVSGLWVTVSLIILLLCGEIGSFIFSLAAAIFPGRSAKLIFRTFSIASACIALLANVTITLSHPTPDALVYQWFLTLFLPLLILGIALFGEKLLLAHLEHRANAETLFKEASKAWQRYQESPETHPKFRKIFRQNVIAQLRDAQNPVNRKKLDYLLVNYPDALKMLFVREYSRHEVNFEFTVDDASRPTLPPEMGDTPNLLPNSENFETPSLQSGTQ